MKRLMILMAIGLAGCGKSGAPVSALDAAARQTCIDTIESRAVNRKSISYAGDDPAVAKDAKGQLEVSIQFSAKNEIGRASSMLAKCTVSPDGKTLAGIVVKDLR